MKRNGNIVSYTIDELKAMEARGETRSNWAAADAMTEEELEAAIASDPDEAGMVIDWSKATTTLPEPKAVLNMRVDRDILHFFRKMGKGYQTKINAVLRTYIEQTQEKR